MLDEYYHTELAYYRMLAQELAREYPEIRHLVSERRGDPAVERVMQGAALLTARLRARMDDDFPEIIHSLFESMWPQYLRPEPAIALLQFVPRPNVLRQSQRVPRGTEVKSIPVEGRECPFQTTSDVVLHPLCIDGARLDQPHPADLQLRLRLSLLGGVMFDNVSVASLRLHLLGDPATRHTLYLWLTHALRRVSVEDGSGQVVLTLPAAAVTPVGLADDEHLYPFRPTLIPGLRLVEEYFAFPDKFLGLDVGGLDRVGRGRLEGELELVFHLGEPPGPGIRVSADTFAIGCAPVINLSARDSLEIPVLPGITEYRLEPDGEREVFTVERVGAHDARSNEWIDYPRLYTRGQKREEDRRPRYQLLRRSDGVEGVETFVAIRDASGRPTEPPAEALHVDYTYTNGNLPLRLNPGDVCVPTSSSPEYCEFQNLTQVASPAPLRVARDRHWELLALFSMHPSDLHGREGLQQALQTCHTARAASAVLPRVASVQSERRSRLHRQTVVPVTRLTVVLEQEAFGTEGELFLFARVLSELLLQRPDDLAFTEVHVRGTGGGETYRFGPR